ncbi:MAG: DNA polymerase III subunit beta [Flavobacteriales bacterium]|nr:DNA polymerase III subunit beta [Flavobacteriales bacterium]
MKFIISSDNLLKTIQPLIGVVGNNSALPIIENVLLELNKNILRIKATDLQTTIINTTHVESESNESIAVNAKLLLETLKSFPEQPLTFKTNTENNTLEITSDQGNYTLSYVNSEEFPNTPELDDSQSIIMSVDTLKKGIKNTLFATSNDELRPVINGISIEINKENMLFVATDAHKLVKYENKIETNDSASFIVPKKPLQLLKNILNDVNEDVQIQYNKTNIICSCEGMEIYCRLVDGNYPNYAAVIPQENPNQLCLDRNILLNSLKRVSIFSNQSTRRVKFKISGSELIISGEDLDFSNKANETLKCDYDGNDIEIAFNGKFLIEILSTLESNKINMYFSNPSKAAIIKPDDNIEENEDVLMLIMPMHIDDQSN